MAQISSDHWGQFTICTNNYKTGLGRENTPTTTSDQHRVDLALKAPISSQQNFCKRYCLIKKLLLSSTSYSCYLIFTFCSTLSLSHSGACYSCEWQPAVFQLYKLVWSLFINHLKADLMLISHKINPGNMRSHKTVKSNTYCIFVEEIQHHIGNPGITPVPVNKQELFQMPKPWDCKVTRHHRLQWKKSWNHHCKVSPKTHRQCAGVSCQHPQTKPE